jgi:hypothetical protein
MKRVIIGWTAMMVLITSAVAMDHSAAVNSAISGTSAPAGEAAKQGDSLSGISYLAAVQLGRCCYTNPAGHALCLTVPHVACSNIGGVWTPNVTCDTPCPSPTGRCCYRLPGTTIAQCAMDTRGACDSLQGLWSANLNCNEPCPVPGRCCYRIPGTILVQCATDLQSACDSLQGHWTANSTCDTPCPIPGRCCYVNPATNQRLCTVDTRGACDSLQGLWSANLNCNEPCPVPGRCCYRIPGTTIVQCATDLQSACDSLQGHWTANSSCDSPCPVPGRCCYVDPLTNQRLCAVDTQGACDSLQGLWTANVTCDAPCVRSDGRCCYTDAAGLPQCTTDTQIECERLQGTWAANLSCDVPCVPVNCNFPYDLVDLGDLPTCGYPTLPGNPAHGLSGVAWLGSCITGESVPNGVNQDSCDDGVVFLNLPWTPCAVESVRVTVTGGQNYDRYVLCGGHLYLSAWKDGNLDGDFCDNLPCGGALASEWIIQDQPVTPGVFTFRFVDPGVTNIGRYAGVFRFRLTSHPVGAFGFGQAVTGACNSTCGTFALDSVGEVEDYGIPDAQLFVELNSFDADANDNTIRLTWVTASESQNDHFELTRDDRRLATIPSQGNGPTGHTYSYVDHSVTAGTSYAYTLIAVDVNGGRSELASRSVIATGQSTSGLISEYSLRQNYPNPFNPLTSIGFDLVDRGTVSLRVYNVMGEEVANLVDGDMPAGTHSVTFDGESLPSGLYLYRLQINGFVAEKKMLLIK